MIVSETKCAEMNALIVKSIKSQRNITPDDANNLQVDFDSLSSYFSQLFIRHLKVKQRNLNNNVAVIVERVANGESLRKISSEFHLGTYKIARAYLEAVFGSSFQVVDFFSNPNIISDSTLRIELLRMLCDDPVCSFEVDIVKECLGREYEQLLINLLRQRDMCFETESDQRSRGKPKTPDILFLIPMGIASNRFDRIAATSAMDGGGSAAVSPLGQGSATITVAEGDGDGEGAAGESSEYYVINWIDSKAMFADVLTFEEHLEQLKGYNNRYGRGLVIYWHGCSIEVYRRLQNDMIIVRDSFPSEWINPCS